MPGQSATPPRDVQITENEQTDFRNLSFRDIVLSQPPVINSHLERHLTECFLDLGFIATPTRQHKFLELVWHFACHERRRIDDQEVETSIAISSQRFPSPNWDDTPYGVSLIDWDAFQYIVNNFVETFGETLWPTLPEERKHLRDERYLEGDMLVRKMVWCYEFDKEDEGAYSRSSLFWRRALSRFARAVLRYFRVLQEVPGFMKGKVEDVDFEALVEAVLKG